MNLRTCLLLLCSLLWLSEEARSQDPYFSQYTQIPSVYNPAMTGMHDAVLKVGLLYQDHLNFSNSSIRKGVLNVDYGKDIEVGNYVVDRIGVGLGLIYDDFNLGAFFNNSLYFNVAYLKSLNSKNNQKLGLGLQLQYGNRTVDYSRLTYGTQFLQGYYDKTISSGEVSGSRSADYFDVQAGLTYHFLHRFFNLKLGVAAFHLTQPASKDINNFKIPLSYSAFANLETWFKNKKHLYVDVYYRNKSMLIDYYGIFTRYTVMNFGEYNSKMEDNYLLVGINVNSNLLVSPYLGWKSPSFDAGVSFDLSLYNVDYFAYPFESFLEFIVAYKLQPKSKAERAIGAELY